MSDLALIENEVNNKQIARYSTSLTDSQGFELAQRAAKLLSSSDLVPKNYQGNIANCVIALNMAQRIGADPLMVMQNLTPIHGKPSWSSIFLIATVNTCGRFSTLRYEFFGEKNTDDWGCRAWAIEKASGDKLVGTDITISIAKKEGWYGKSGSKWQSMPQQMLMYRAGAWWTRAYAPELSLGLQTTEEVLDVFDNEYTSKKQTPFEERKEENQPPKTLTFGEFEAKKQEWKNQIEFGLAPQELIEKEEKAGKVFTEAQKKELFSFRVETNDGLFGGEVKNETV
jgi:hypothetical protein